MADRYPPGIGGICCNMVYCRFICFNNMAIDWQKVLMIAFVTGIVGIVIYFLWDCYFH